MNNADGKLEVQQQPEEHPENTSVNNFDLEKIDPIAAAIYRGWPGIPWAGGIYAMSITLVATTLEVIFYGRFPIGISWLICLLPFFIGTLIATFTGIVACYICWLFHRTFFGLVCGRTAVAISGGLAGFLSTCWLAVFGFPDLFGLLLVFGAILFGQAGALWSASPARDWNKMALAPGGSGFQFEIKHMLILFVWIGAVLGLNQLSKTNSVVVAVCFYVVAQILVVALDRRIYFLRESWRSRRVEQKVS